MRIFFLIGVFLFAYGASSAQSISDLQKKKQNATKEIRYTSNLLKKTQKNEKTSLSKLRLLNSKISRRTTVISSINNEIGVFDEFIANNTLVIKMLKSDIEELKKEYAEMVKMAYKNKDTDNKLLFLFSAKSFNQAYRRLLHFRRYTSFRQNQTEIIQAIQVVLDENLKNLEQQKAKKQQLVGAVQQEKLKLSEEKGQQNTVLQKLQKQKRSLQRKLKKQRRVEQQLQREIQRMIEEEARKNRKAGKAAFALTPEQKLVGDKFEQNKRRLPWPLERGVIVEHFGVHKHPVLSNVQVQNNGINIAAETDAKVRAIFNGEVSRVFAITGGNTAVIIRHGKYLTVYSNLREVVVKKGDKVSTKQHIGTVYTDYNDGNKSILKFQIWKESTKLNPEHWIGR